MTRPIGIRLHNPGNLVWNPNNKWQGMVPQEKSTYASKGTAQQKRFCEFISPTYGIRAMAVLLINYQDFHGVKTVTSAIHRWAPPMENDTAAYVNQVQKAVGGDLVDMHDYTYLKSLVEAIIRHENGVGPLKNANTWYEDEVIDEALRMAGVKRATSKIPMTKETVGASATGAVGAVEIADALPGVVSAIKGAEGSLSSGNLAQMVVGAVLVGAALFIAYSQVKRHRTGQL